MQLNRSQILEVSRESRKEQTSINEMKIRKSQTLWWKMELKSFKLQKYWKKQSIWHRQESKRRSKQNIRV